jgi:flagellar hook assembly protein FlgD
LRVKINIYNQNGQRVRGWEQRFTPASPVSDAIAWDGRGPNGQRLSPGFYTVRLQVVSTETGAQEAAVKKLILLR